MAEDDDKTLPAPVVTPRAVVTSPIAIFDTNTFEHLWRVSKAMAASSVIPMSLRAEKKGGSQNWTELPAEQVFGNCLQIVEQAHRWQMSPFAVAQCTSVVHGKLMFEGKLVAAVIDAGLGIKLDYEFGKWDATKEECILGQGEGTGDDLAVRVFEISAQTGERGRYVDGCVKHWKTTGNNTPWREGAFKRQLRYRGAREWTRAHEPALLLGVYTDDDRFEIEDEYRAQSARVVSSGVAARVTDQRQERSFSAEQIDNDLGLDKSPRNDTVIDGEVIEEKTEAAPAASEPAQDETAGTTSEPEATSDEESGGRGGVSEPSAPSISADEKQLLNDYHRALNRASSLQKLEALDKEFAAEHKDAKPKDEALKVMGEIYGLHADRHEGKIKATEVHEKIKTLLA